MQKLRGISFSKAIRQLTNTKGGPGPSDYITRKNLFVLKQTAPRAAFTKQDRTIDVIKCK